MRWAVSNGAVNNTTHHSAPNTHTQSHILDSSYLYLFVEFAVLRFIVAPRRRAAQLKAKKAAEPPAPSLLKKVSSMVTGTEPGADPAADGGVPLLRPRLTNQESAYSYHFELPGEGEEDKGGKRKAKKL